MVKILPARVGDMGLNPGSGRFHMLGATKLSCHNYSCPCAWSPHSATRETITVRIPCTLTREYPPLTATRESPCTAVKTQSSHKQIKFLKQFENQV